MKKIISVIKEKAPGEIRVILAPKEVTLLKKANYEVLIERGAGENVGIKVRNMRIWVQIWLIQKQHGIIAIL